MEDKLKKYENVKKFLEIIQKYKNGEYGNNHLSLSEILIKAGAEDLLNQMSIEELVILIETSSGITKLLFINLKQELIDRRDNQPVKPKEKRKKLVEY